MYIPKHFAVDDPHVLAALVQAHPLATIISTQGGQVNANHIPLILSAKEQAQILQGHIAKVNSLWRDVDDDSEVLVIFQGPDGYISPNWYPSKQEHGKVVPTWNYATVHVRGRIRFIEDQAWKLSFLNQLTDQHENKQAKPWSVSDAPVDYTGRLLEAIVGLEISVDSIEGKYKLSQNQSPLNYQGVIEGLQTQDSVETGALLDMMRKKKENE